MNKQLYEKYEVAKYLARFHQEYYDSPISKIKMQKGLYFLYAFFSQFVYRSQNSEIAGDFPTEISNELFNADFQAWAYGPVDRDIYKEYDKILIAAKKFDVEEFLAKSESDLVSDFLQTLTTQIFNSTDFGLVELSHQDEAWKKHYDKSDRFSSEKIPNNEIIDEYKN